MRTLINHSSHGTSHYWKRELGSPVDVLQLLTWAYSDSTRPQWEMIHAVYGFKEALQPYVTKISGHSKARSFCFIKYQENVAMFYKESSLDKQ